MRKVETGGQAGYVGYEYQILVSVWVALELMLAKKMSSEVEIEPATDEDIAANLKGVDPDTTVKVPLGGTNLQVQVKHRSSHWTQTAFKDVLNGKPPAQPKAKTDAADKTTGKKCKKKGTPRQRALAILAVNPSAKYVMISDATVDAALRPFEVGSLLERSGATTLPWAKPDSIAANVPPRLAILPGRTRELLELAIDKILGEHASVPAQKREDCREALAATVRLRLLNKLPGKWTLEELQRTIGQHGGYWDTGPSLVLPDNFEIFEETLNRYHAVLITGSAGTGKTTVAKELVRRRKSGPDAAAFIHSSQGLGAVNQALERRGKCVC